jgi:hypothetical protein
VDRLIKVMIRPFAEIPKRWCATIAFDQRSRRLRHEHLAWLDHLGSYPQP